MLAKRPRSGLMRSYLTLHISLARVPGFPSPVCPCGQARETAEHVIAHCNRFAECRAALRNPRTRQLDIKGLVDDPGGAARLARWFIQLRILPQYSLAAGLLYGEEGAEEDEQPDGGELLGL